MALDITIGVNVRSNVTSLVRDLEALKRATADFANIPTTPPPAADLAAFTRDELSKLESGLSAIEQRFREEREMLRATEPVSAGAIDPKAFLEPFDAASKKQELLNALLNKETETLGMSAELEHRRGLFATNLTKRTYERMAAEIDVMAAQANAESMTGEHLQEQIVLRARANEEARIQAELNTASETVLERAGVIMTHSNRTREEATAEAIRLLMAEEEAAGKETSRANRRRIQAQAEALATRQQMSDQATIDQRQRDNAKRRRDELFQIRETQRLALVEERERLSIQKTLNREMEDERKLLDRYVRMLTVRDPRTIGRQPTNELEVYIDQRATELEITERMTRAAAREFAIKEAIRSTAGDDAESIERRKKLIALAEQSIRAYDRENQMLRKNTSQRIGNSIGTFVLGITVTQTTASIEQMSNALAENAEQAEEQGKEFLVSAASAKAFAQGMNEVSQAIRFALGPIQVYTAIIQLASAANRDFLLTTGPIAASLLGIAFIFKGMTSTNKTTARNFKILGGILMSLALTMALLTAATKAKAVADAWATASATMKARAELQAAKAAGVATAATQAQTTATWGKIAADVASASVGTLGLILPFLIGLIALAVAGVMASKKAQTMPGQYREVLKTGPLFAHAGERVYRPGDVTEPMVGGASGSGTVNNFYIAGDLDRNVARDMNMRFRANQAGGY